MNFRTLGLISKQAHSCIKRIHPYCQLLKPNLYTLLGHKTCRDVYVGRTCLFHFVYVCPYQENVSTFIRFHKFPIRWNKLILLGWPVTIFHNIYLLYNLYSLKGVLLICAYHNSNFLKKFRILWGLNIIHSINIETLQIQIVGCLSYTNNFNRIHENKKHIRCLIKYKVYSLTIWMSLISNIAVLFVNMF